MYEHAHLVIKKNLFFPSFSALSVNLFPLFCASNTHTHTATALQAANMQFTVFNRYSMASTERRPELYAEIRKFQGQLMAMLCGQSQRSLAVPNATAEPVARAK